MSRQLPDLPPVDDTALAPLLASLTAPPTPSELDGITPALVALRTAQVTSLPATAPRRRPSMLLTIAGAKLGATIAGIAVGLGGAATVVYASANVPMSVTHATASATTVPAASPTTGATETEDATETESPDPTETETPDATETESPDPTETETPDATDTPDATKSPDATGTAVGPDATGPAAHGLCTAWRALTSHGNGHGKAMESIPFTNLAKAAGGADKIAAYCATVAAPGASGNHATGKPSAAHGNHATGKSSAAHGKSSTAHGKSSAAHGKSSAAHGKSSAAHGKPATAPTKRSHPTGRH